MAVMRSIKILLLVAVFTLPLIYAITNAQQQTLILSPLIRAGISLDARGFVIGFVLIVLSAAIYVRRRK